MVHCAQRLLGPLFGKWIPWKTCKTHQPAIFVGNTSSLMHGTCPHDRVGERSSRNGSKYPFKSGRGTRNFAWAYIAVAVRLRLGPTIMSSGDSVMVGIEHRGHIVNKMNLSASKPMLGLDLGFSRPIRILAKVICMGDGSSCHIPRCIMECEPANKQAWCRINWGNNFHTRVSIGAPKAYHRVLKKVHPCIKKQCACIKNQTDV